MQARFTGLLEKDVETPSPNPAEFPPRAEAPWLRSNRRVFSIRHVQEL